MKKATKFGIDGKTLKSWIDWLKKENEGCCHKKIGDTNKHEIDIVVGWHKNDNDEWSIHWKIGQQSFNNCMQCDFDIDFDMPYFSNGEVINTCTEIIIPDGKRFAWNKLAAEINKEARLVFKQAKRIDY